MVRFVRFQFPMYFINILVFVEKSSIPKLILWQSSIYVDYVAKHKMIVNKPCSVSGSVINLY